MTRIFISHSYLDEAIAYKLVNFLLAALSIKEEEILCSSNPDQGLSYIPTAVTDQLKEQLKSSESLIVLITADSLHSAWIPFEVGAFWTTDKTLIPIMGPGLTHDDLPGPLRSLLSISIDAQDWSDKVNNAINQIIKQLNIRQKVTRRRNDTFQEFSDALRAWKSQRPAAPDLQQENEQLKAQMQELERLHNNQLEVQERSHDNQLKEQKELLEAKIKKLEGDLTEARSQTKQSQAKERSQNKVQSFAEDLEDGIKLEMIAIPGGKFMMGSPEGEGEDNEKPQHEVTVQPFLIGKYPVTQAQYERVMGKNPSKFSDDDRRPVERVSWNDAVEFCRTISEKTGKEYRLPTEAEWEYACRAGTTTQYNFGDKITDKLANYGNNVKETTVGGKYPPNAFGLYDMHGLVWEWCQDDYYKDYLGAPNDGSAWLSGKINTKVLRGGSWIYNPNNCRSAFRYCFNPEYADFDYGFRVVCRVPRT